MILQPNKIQRHIIEWIQSQLHQTPLRSVAVEVNERPESLLLIKWLQAQHQIPLVLWSKSSSATHILQKQVTSQEELLELAEEQKSLLLGDYNRPETLYSRPFKKWEPIDLFPLGDLYRSEVLELLQQSGDTQSELEWLDRENQKSSIVTQESDPAKSPNFWHYLGNQQKLLAQMHQREKLTRHKAVTEPICKLRSLGWTR